MAVTNIATAIFDQLASVLCESFSKYKCTSEHYSCVDRDAGEKASSNLYKFFFGDFSLSLLY